MDLSGLKSEVDGMIQGVGDNFDQQICSQNGKLQTHSMALLMTQTQSATKMLLRNLYHDLQSLILSNKFPMILKSAVM